MRNFTNILVILFSFLIGDNIVAQEPDKKPVKTEEKKSNKIKTKEELLSIKNEGNSSKQKEIDIERARQRELLKKEVELQRKKDIEEYELLQKKKNEKN